MWGVQGAIRREGYQYGVRLYPSPQAEELGYPEGVVIDGEGVADLIDDIRARGLVIWPLDSLNPLILSIFSDICLVGSLGLL